jgi:hypothetical protein
MEASVCGLAGNQPAAVSVHYNAKHPVKAFLKESRLE